jgi:hypothetical protein
MSIEALSAREVLTNPFVVTLLDELEQNFMVQWSNARDIDERENLFYRLQGLRSFRAELESRLLTSKMRR